MNVEKQKFAGDKKAGQSLLTGVETQFKNWAVPHIPAFIETYHLTLTTILWSIGNTILAFYARENLAMLWLVSLMIILQYVTDLLDGELGRKRQTGLIKWGFYMDHFLDYIFLCSLVFVGFMISPPGLGKWHFGLLGILGGFMVNSFLSFAAINKFEIYHFGMGPTEFRCVLILINTGIIFMGTDLFIFLVPAVTVVCLVALIVNAYFIHRKLWQIDMAALENNRS